MTALPGARITPPGRGRLHRIGPDRFRTKGPVVGDGDGFAVIEYEGRPGIPGPPAHVHRAFEEAWFLLEGRVEFRAGSRRSVVGKGAYVLVPRGVSHTFRVLGTTPARWVGVFSPGRYVRLVEELGRILPRNGPPDPRRIAELFARYDTEMVP